MFLATQDEKSVLALFDRWAKHHPDQPKSAYGKIKDEIAVARERGFAAAFDIVLPDTGAIAMPLRTQQGGEPMIVAVAGLNHRIHSQEIAIIKSMQRLIAPLTV